MLGYFDVQNDLIARNLKYLEYKRPKYNEISGRLDNESRHVRERGYRDSPRPYGISRCDSRKTIACQHAQETSDRGVNSLLTRSQCVIDVRQNPQHTRKL